MKTILDGDSVFVADDSFVNLHESPAVFGSCHDFCVASAVAMYGGGADSHVSYVDAEDAGEVVGFKEDGKIMKVTIEWVDSSEANLDNYERSGVCSDNKVVR